MLKVVDVSEFQGNINWEEAKNHIDGAILRCGYGNNNTSQDDKWYKTNADACTKLGIPFGVYLYSYSRTPEQTESEIAHVLRLVKGYKLSFPIYLDLEENGTQAGVVDRANRFIKAIQDAGYPVGVYANEYWWETFLHGVSDVTKWVACYSTVKPSVSNYDAWQYTSNGVVQGILGRVDLSEFYRDFPKELGKNDAKPASKPSAPIVNTAAKIKAKVVTYQKWMNSVWHYGISEDGVWGAETNCACIKTLQTITGAVPDGIVGDETRSRMPNLEYGDEGYIVKWYQGLCSKFGYWDVDQDGVYGKVTKTATETYQKAKGLNADGIAGVHTISSMLS